MEDLTVTLSNYVKQANEAFAANDFEKACKCILHAEECALLLAKKSAGTKRAQYLEKYNLLKELYNKAANHGKTSADKGEAAPSVSPKQEEPSKDELPKKPSAGKPAGANPLSPMWLKDYIGQPQAVTAVSDLIHAARLKNSAMPHLILYGSHGLGKTTFAHIIANEMGVNFTEVNVSKINVPEMIAILKKIKPRDIVFIDEIHTLPLVVAESVLYSAMQDGKISYVEGKGKTARTQELALPPFTLIGATTEIGKLAKPFMQRAIQIRLEEYSDEVLGGIIVKSFYKLGMQISNENGLYIAKRCRNNPRIANNMVRRISDKALVRYAAINGLKDGSSFESVEAIRKLSIQITPEVINSFFEENGIDEYGLENGDRELLKIMITRYNGGPVGIDTLARVMNESNNVISQKYEAYLIKKGLMRIDRDGRVVMPEGYKVLGLPVPEDKQSPADAAPTNEGEEKGRYETRKVVACHVPHPLKCAKTEELITYPENAGTFEASLDELFPDVEKPYEEVTQHRCRLEIDFDGFKRTLICDSFLESRFATALAGVGYLHDIKAQSLELSYISQELANRRYFPDFFIKDYKNRIAVIEMKNYEMLTYHLNIDKYEMLKNYCEKMGYGYAEVAKGFNSENYVSVEMIKNRPVDRELEEYIFSVIEKKAASGEEGIFTESDYLAYQTEHGAMDKTEIYTVLLNNRKLKNTDRVGNNLRIILS